SSYWRDATQSALAPNSVFKATYFFGQELPGLPLLMCFIFSSSLVFPLKLLNGTPSGEISLKYKSSSLAFTNFSKVSLSTVVASGTSKKGVPHPTESIWYWSNKN